MGNDKIERARLLATFIHLGQRRSDGEDYIKHCERIVHKLASDFFDSNLATTNEALPLTQEQEDMICAAWLHDTVEDSPMGRQLFIVINAYFGPHVTTLISLLTHDEEETYNEYIAMIAKHPEALQIKWLDMIDNTSYNIPKKQWEKYRNACLMLMLSRVTVPDILVERLILEE